MTEKDIMGQNLGDSSPGTRGYKVQERGSPYHPISSKGGQVLPLGPGEPRRRPGHFITVDSLLNSLEAPPGTPEVSEAINGAEACQGLLP